MSPIGRRMSRAAGSRRLKGSEPAWLTPMAAASCGCRDGDANLRLNLAQGGWIRGVPVQFAARMVLLLVAGLALGACSALPDVDSFRAPDAATLFRPLSVTGFKEKPVPPVTAEDLVDAAGRCAGAFANAEAAGAPAMGQPVQLTAGAPPGQTAGPSSAQADVRSPAQTSVQPPAQTPVSLQEPDVPMIPAPVALGMTECDVVKRAGVADNVQIGANERGERSITLTFLHGARPGIYHFVTGRLKSMERAPEPPAPPKPVKRSRRMKRAATR